MLRRLSTFLVCFVLIVFFVQTAEAQRTFHISDPNHAGINGVDPNGDPNVFYYDSLEHLWADIPVVYTIDQGQDSIDFVLYADQQIGNNHAANSFFSIESSIVGNRQITFRTHEDQSFSIAPAPGSFADTDFLRSSSQYTHINISSSITITAGSNNDVTSDRSATTIGGTTYGWVYGGGNLNAAGVTYINGGPVTVDYNYGGTGSPRGTNAGDVHSTVNLEGTSFINNSYNAVSRGAALYIKDPVNSGTAVNLQNSKFIDNNGWGLRIEVNDATYRGTANVGILLSAAEGEQTIFQGNGDWAWVANPNYDPTDPDSTEPEFIRERQDSGPGRGIIFGGSRPYSGTSQATITATLGGAGEILMYDNMYGESTAESGGNYRMRINKNGSGTLWLAEGTVHQFNGTSQGTLGTGNRSNVWTHSAGIMDMGKDVRIELTESFDQFVFSGGTIILRGSTDPTGANNVGNYIQAHTIDLSGRTTFQIAGDVINELTPTNKAVLTIDADVLTQPPNGSLIDFDILGVRGNITNKVLIHNEGDANFAFAAGTQPTGNPHRGRTYRALIDGNDVIDTARITAYVWRGDDYRVGDPSLTAKDLVLNVTLNNTIVTAVRLTTGTGPITWNVAGSVNWKYEIESPTGYTTQNDMIRSSFIPNDAVIFNDFGKEGLTFNVMAGGVYISQQVGYVSQNTPIDPSADPADYLFRQEHRIEYGMRISGVNNWTFNGGSINDDYHPDQLFHEEQINHVGRLTFEGIGTANLFNSNPNVYHDGTVIGNRGYDPDSITNGGHFDSNAVGFNPNNPSFDIERNTIMNVYGPGSMGSGKYAGEVALVDSDMDGNKDDQYVIQADGFGLKFVGYGGTVNILNNSNYTALETDTLFDQRIRVVNAGNNTIVDTIPVGVPGTDPYDPANWTYRDDVATRGIIRMEEGRVDSDGELIHIKVSAGDAYWVNHGRLTGENISNNGVLVNTINSGGVIFIDPNTSFEMTGHFDFSMNRILRSYEGTPITSIDFDNFDGGVLWVGYGASINMTGTSFTDNGGFYDRTSNGTGYDYTLNGNVRYGGAIYFTGGRNQLTDEGVATLTLSAGADGRTEIARNIADVGGALFVSQGAGAVINVENVDFDGNIAMAAGTPNDPVGGGAIYIWNEPGADGSLQNVELNADGAGFDNNIANGAPGGAIRLFQGNTVSLNNSSFLFNGVTVTTTTNPDNGEVTREIDQIVTTYGGALFTGGSTQINAVGSSFVSNAVQGDGGAVFTVGEQEAAKSNSFDFSGGTFEGNIAAGSVTGSGYGGAIFSVYTKLTGDGATFEKNIAQIDGGAVYVLGGQTLNGVPNTENDVFDFSNATFRENEAVTGHGGAIYADGTVVNGVQMNGVQLIGVDSVFEYNKAGGNGGAIYVRHLEKVQGAVINLGTDNATSRQTIFRGNDAGGEGGAIYLVPGDLTLVIDNAIFDDNTTGIDTARGGAIYAGNDSVTITGRGVQFNNNMYGIDGRGVGQEGGAIYLGNYGIINLRDSFSFSGNRVTNADNGRGGAIYTRIGANLSLTNGSFDSNIATQEGGAIYTATDVGVDGSLTFTGTSFSNNRAEQLGGGAIYAKNMIISGEESDFYMNRAATKGGALHIESDYALDVDHDSKTINLENSVFEYNIAGGTGDDNGGGAIFIDFDGATLEADGTQFLGNEAESHGGAIYAQAETVLNVNNSVFDISFDNVDADNEPKGNTSLSGHGGAIYLNGSLNNVLEATSTLNAKGTTFISSSAGGNGGAVYLYYADADISGAVFRYNAADGLGGGLYYENEDGNELIIESTTFEYNRAASGGAVYTVNATLLQAKNTSLIGNQATAGDGGAIYFAAENSQLNISRSADSTAVIEFNTATGDGGAIRMQGNSKLIANGSVFNENEAGGTGGAIRIDAYADIQAANSTFYRNAALGGGGAIMLYDDSVQTFSSVLNLLNLNGSKFQQNTSGGNGGAIHATNTDLNVGSSLFSQNHAAGNGGAVYVQNSDLNAWGTGFQNNTAGMIDGTSKGGAVYFLTTNELDRNIYLGAATGAQTVISGNTMNGTPNSIYFDARGSRRPNITLNVATEAGGRLTMQDPMQVDRTANNPGNNLDLDIVKTGTGIWELGGSNDFSFTRTGTTVDIRQGTFGLLPGATLKLANEYDGLDYFNLHGGSTFTTGGSSNTTGAARLEASHLNFAVNTKMVLNEELILDISNNYNIASRLSGNGGLTKQDASWLTFRGATDNYNGNVSIKHGRFSIAKHNDVAGSGRFETGGSFYMGPGTHLYMIADVTQPTLVAKSATIDLVNLHVSGIAGDYDKEFILIHTTDGIYGNFDNVNADGSLLSAVDYLTFNLGFLNDRKDYGGSIGLRWYSTDTSMPAWGKFTLKEEDDYFNVAVELHDNNFNLYTGDPSDPGYDPDWPWRWDGTTLDKLGLGTLELSAQNTYTGATTVHAGELYVTHLQGTGLGGAPVEVKNGARLGLNFNGAYEKTVTGEGKVVIRGGVVELAGTNSYSGGTDLKDGVLEFTTKENLGTGTITFDGGILRNLAEATLDQDIAIANKKTARFDVPLYQADASIPSLTVTGVISGNGDLEKTGSGTLALGGVNTYTGTSYVREGGLKIDGSVAGDVRVSQYAAVGGTGTVGGDLFINSGGYFDWYFTPNRSESGPLNVAGSVNLANGSVFRPRTDSTDFTQPIVGWTVMTYGGVLGGQFTAIDDTFNAYYNFSLDYSQPGEIRVDGELLTRPKAMGDIVATSLALANKKLYRNAFSQMMRETTYRKMPTPGYDNSVRGQAAEPTRSMWYTPMARANKFGTTFVGGNYDFEAYGMQAGSTLWSNNTNTLGLMFGYERGNLRNRLDQIRSHDYYLGLYYGHLFNDGIELRGFVGGGFQKYTMFRSDTENRYTTSYDGSSFEMNVELGKLFAGQNGTLLRPYIAADIEHGTISSAQEKKVGNAYRHYDKADLSQFFFRFGLDLEKRWQYVDLNGGLGYSCLLLGKRRAEASIFYPVRGAGTPSYSARLGRSSLLLKTGLNWHLDRRRMNSIFLDYFADIYMDRAGDTVQHQAGVGYQLRF